MSKQPNQPNGFTLTEILVALAVTGMLMLTFINFSSNSIMSTSIIGARSDLLGEAQQALDVIARDIRFSSNAEDNNRIIDVNAPDGTDAPLSWESNDTALVLAISATDNSNKVIFDDPLHYFTLKNNVIYFVKEKSLYRRTLAADNPDNAARTSCPAAVANTDCPEDRLLIADNVKSFSVRYLHADGTEAALPSEARSIEATLALSTKRYGQQLETTYKTHTVFRNE